MLKPGRNISKLILIMSDNWHSTICIMGAMNWASTIPHKRMRSRGVANVVHWSLFDWMMTVWGWGVIDLCVSLDTAFFSWHHIQKWSQFKHDLRIIRYQWIQITNNWARNRFLIHARFWSKSFTRLRICICIIEKLPEHQRNVNQMSSFSTFLSHSHSPSPFLCLFDKIKVIYKMNWSCRKRTTNTIANTQIQTRAHTHTSSTSQHSLDPFNEIIRSWSNEIGRASCRERV